MDNGLIFPYPLERARDEAGDTNRPSRVLSLRVRCVGERGI